MKTQTDPRLPTKTQRLWIGARVSPTSAAVLAEERARTGESLGRVLDRAVLALAGSGEPARQVAPPAHTE